MMRVGISICSNYGVHDAREGAQKMIARARAANDASLDTLFLGDHHVTARPYYQNVPMMGRLLAEWGDRPAGALFLLPLWHPVLLAEQIATLAAIMPARFIMQCGLGDEQQSVAMGVPFERRVGMFKECLRLLRALLAGEVVSSERYWDIREARISPTLSEPLEVWVGSVVAPAINRTAQLAEGWLASPGLNHQQAADALNLYRQACAEHAREPTAVAIRRDVCIARTTAEAEAGAARMLAKGYRGIDPAALVVGSVAEAVDRFGTLAELGYTDVIVRNIAQEQDAAITTIECLADVRRQLQ